MERLIRWMLLFVAVGLTVQTARPHFRYGEWLDASSTLEVLGVSIPFGMGSIMVLLHVGKAMTLAAAAAFWNRSQYVRCTLAILLFPLLVAVSVTSTLAFLDLQRGERAASAATRVKHEADLRAELAAIEARLMNIGWQRAPAVVESEIAAEHRHPYWASTEGCSKATTHRQRRYCGALDRLAGEFAAAKEADDDRRREKGIRAELLGMKTTNGSTHADLDFLSRALEVSLERAGFWRTLLFAAAIEVAEALLFLFGTVPANDGRRCDRCRRCVVGLRSLVQRALKRTKWKPRPTADKSSPASQGGEAQKRTKPHISHPAAVRSAPRREKTSCARAGAGSTIESDEPPTPSGSATIMPETAVDAFVAECPRAPDARVPGSAMFAAYDKLRVSRGWPRLSPGVFGRHLKPAIQRAGGTKVKANAQVYVGLGLSIS